MVKTIDIFDRSNDQYLNFVNECVSLADEQIDGFAINLFESELGLSPLNESAGDVIGSICEKIVAIFKGFVDFIISIIGKVVDVITGLFDGGGGSSSHGTSKAINSGNKTVSDEEWAKQYCSGGKYNSSEYLITPKRGGEVVKDIYTTTRDMLLDLSAEAAGVDGNDLENSQYVEVQDDKTIVESAKHKANAVLTDYFGKYGFVDVDSCNNKNYKFDVYHAITKEKMTTNDFITICKDKQVDKEYKAQIKTLYEIKHDAKSDLKDTNYLIKKAKKKAANISSDTEEQQKAICSYKSIMYRNQFQLKGLVSMISAILSLYTISAKNLAKFRASYAKRS